MVVGKINGEGNINRSGMINRKKKDQEKEDNQWRREISRSEKDIKIRGERQRRKLNLREERTPKRGRIIQEGN